MPEAGVCPAFGLDAPLAARRAAMPQVKCGCFRKQGGMVGRRVAKKLLRGI